MADDRRPPFRGPSFDRGRDHRGGDRPDRPAGDRPGFGPGPRPFPPRPATRGGDLPPAPHSVRLRNGDREIEVCGAPAFVRQVLDDLPSLLGRLSGEVPARSAVALPAPPSQAAPPPSQASPPPANGHGEATPANGRATKPARAARATSPAEVEELVFEVLRGSDAPLAVAAIRKRLPGTVTGQQVRRILERAPERVRATGERPATYSLR